MPDEDSSTPSASRATLSKKSNRLSARTVATAKPGMVYHDGAGVYLKVSKLGSARFCYRFTWNHKPTEYSLGSTRVVTLFEARTKAYEARKLVAAGINPVTARRDIKRREANRHTFGECAVKLIESKRPGWRSEKHAKQWSATLSTHAEALWSMPVDEIGTNDVLKVLQPVWQRVPETASRVRSRIEAVLDYAKARKWRSGENPAVWRGNLSHILPRRQSLTRKHFAAMAFADVPGFIGKLREQETAAALALEFLILTAARSGEALGALWAEFDLDAKVWTIPAARMKSGLAHRVPLSGRAWEILAELSKARSGEFVFPGQRRGRPLSPTSIEMVLKKMGIENATPHGFRSSFSDWASETTAFPHEVIEGCLAHAVGSAVSRAYRRTDVLEKRRAVLGAWAAFCDGGRLWRQSALE